ncbi:MAG: FAD-binding protein [Sphingobacteriaceae bacterium]|jgi:flavin-dependent dehydrogenase|nr:FAD-binding protein [Sphingobacteriaceae bacterium]
MKARIIIIGGGIAGLTSSILLAKAGFEVTVVEKKQYPFHRVCGEYVSNEVMSFLQSLNIDVEECGPSHISKLTVTSPKGKGFHHKLELGGFGLSRFEFDTLLYRKALSEGVEFSLGEKANDVAFADNQFEVTLSNNIKLQAGLVIASHGKRSNLDQKLSRDFFYKRSPYIGVKYHIRTDFPADTIQLDNFEGGYCGIEKIEGDKFCLCYLAENRLLKKHGSIQAIEQNVLHRNPSLKRHFAESEFLFDRPEVINEISFEQKSLVENHILFCGDAAGMITPLCGNGMAMAMHSAKLLSDIISRQPIFKEAGQRAAIEQEWERMWKAQFASRLKTGRAIQRLFGNAFVSELAISTLKTVPGLGGLLIRNTHGKPFNL